MTELDLRLEHASASANSPGDNRFGDLALLDSLNHAVFLDTTNFTKQKEDLAVWLGLVPKEMVDERSARISVTTNGNTLVDTICVLRDNVVEFVGHTAGFGNVANGTRTVEFGRDDVVHHTTSIANLERSRLDTADCGRANDGDALLLGYVQDLTDTLKKRD